MKKSILISSLALIAGVFLIFYLYFLPKSLNMTDAKPMAKTSQELVEENHQEVVTISDELNVLIQKMESKYNNSSDNEKKIIFADSLGILFSNGMKFDSSIYYFERAFELSSTWDRKRKVALGYFNHYISSTKLSSAMRAKDLLIELLADTTDVELLTKKAVVMVYTETPPMPGIRLLREIIEDNPSYVDARIYLGEFQLKVGKIEASIEQLKEVLAIDKNNIKALWTLSSCYQNLGDKKEELNCLKKIQGLGIEDKYLIGVIEDRLSQLK